MGLASIVLMSPCRSFSIRLYSVRKVWGETPSVRPMKSVSVSFTRWADLTSFDAAMGYASDVAAGTFPGPAETVRMDDAVLDEVLGRGASDRPAGSIPAGGIPLDRDL